MKRGTIRDARRFIKAREDFDCGNLYGGHLQDGPYAVGLAPKGYLPAAWKVRFAFDNPTYVVYSYGTPIAWVADDGREVIPPVKYSVSTNRHQTEAYMAMDTVSYHKLREPAPYELVTA